jgi:hypothetical protein
MKFKIMVAIGVAALLTGCGKGHTAHAQEATLDELNRDLSTLIFHDGGRLPGTNEFNEFLAATGKAFPAPSAGKKVVLDPIAKKFVIQNQ